MNEIQVTCQGCKGVYIVGGYVTDLDPTRWKCIGCLHWHEPITEAEQTVGMKAAREAASRYGRAA